MDKRCETCVFWFVEDKDLTTDVLECRRFPPTGEHTERGEYINYRIPIWPETRKHDWCGEHTPTAAEAEEESAPA